MTPTDMIVSRVTGVRPCSNGYTARCPAHDDHSNSLSIGEGENGIALLKCFVGCTAEAIVQALGLEMSDLFPTDKDLPAKPEATTRRRPLGVDDLATDKCLPIAFLRSLGLEPRPDGVLVPYFEMNGKSATRHRLRTALRAGDGSCWTFGKGRIVPYGLDRLAATRDQGYLIFVEGESDCWTLWHHDFPALGIPGASMTKLLEPEYLDGVSRVYVCREPGQGGQTFIDGTAKRLGLIGWRGQAFVFSCRDFKDPNALHKADPGSFSTKFQETLDAAERIDLESRDGQDRTPIDTDQMLRVSGLTKLTEKSSSQEIECALRRLAEIAMGGDGILRAVLRVAAIKMLKSASIGTPAKLVDAVLRNSSKEAETVSREAFLVDPTPSDDPVDGNELLVQLEQVFTRYIALVDGAAIALALWVLHTFAIDAAYISPILALTSPQKRCGKTTVILVLRALVRKALPAANITPAVVFRTIEHYRPTLLIDEADTFLGGNDELRGVLNSGHTRSTAIVIRTAGDDHEPRTFSTWAPKAIAKIGRLPTTLEDRSIVVPMRRKAPGEQTERVRQERLDGELEELRSQIARWAADHLDALRHADPEVPADLHDRAQDNWRPLLAIAEAVGGNWPRKAREAAVELGRTGADDDGAVTTQLLEDLKRLFDDRDATQLTTKEIVETLIEMEDRPWPEWRKGHPLTARAMARLLKPYGIEPRTLRIGAVTAKGYMRHSFDDAFARYTGSYPSHRNNRGISSDYQDSYPSHGGQCYGSKTTEKARNDKLVTDVTDRNLLDDENTTESVLPDGDFDDDDREVFDV